MNKKEEAYFVNNENTVHGANHEAVVPTVTTNNGMLKRKEKNSRFPEL